MEEEIKSTGNSGCACQSVQNLPSLPLLPKNKRLTYQNYNFFSLLCMNVKTGLIARDEHSKKRAQT
jgi:hypothetical protein